MKMLVKYGQNQLFRSRLSILGQAPSHLNDKNLEQNTGIHFALYLA